MLHSSTKRDAKHYIGTWSSVEKLVNVLNIMSPFIGNPCLNANVNSLLFTMSIAEFWKQVPPNEPYRVILGDVRDKLYNTRERSRQWLANGLSDIPEDTTFTNVEQVSLPSRNPGVFNLKFEL